MKTIATAAVLMVLSAPAWSDYAERNEANSNEPILLSEAEMDEVTAGFEHGSVHYPYISGGVWNGDESSSSIDRYNFGLEKTFF